MYSTATVLKTSPEVIATELHDGETVLLDMESRRYFSLNATGSDIWRRLGEGASFDVLNEALASKYAVEREQLEECVKTLIDELLREKLIQVVDGGSVAES